MFRIYTKEEKSKEVFNVNLNAAELETVLEGDVFYDHKDLNRDDYIVVERENAFDFPLYDEKTNTIDEATREQRILRFGHHKLLQDGEYLDKNKIVKVEIPAGLIRAKWNANSKNWEEGMTRIELIKLRKGKILEYGKLKREIEELELFADEFLADETIEISKQELAKLRKEINDLLEKIKAMPKEM